ncbi:monovalent cation:proton antiporter-2 (CPA2) family protein [Aquabacterium sp. OR-4]|uniref:monovalent cation:proton antiporter-2 (CPA2) family protein n=1 Tax=Aquabacterium sp. OR-4 TaxID=2978127 RepID=UPI0021B4573B|nr:monovalent cation:proton antiporter family protein [Aquabacterium sp. OR-4]MDT7833766.1 monovalent cation:proton antiporter-2 (CPA2) family protein [Aquabacterium sp. OR-4]
MASTLELVLLYLVAAVLGVVGCRLLKLPPMLGYLAVGIVIGPNALALAKDSAGVKYLAEFGVVFLMFVIGLEFNLPKLRSMRTLVFGLGLSQVLLTILGALAGNAALAWAFAALGQRWDLGWQGAFVLGAAMAMSSTAIVVKLMAERLEMESEHGRRVMGVLLFQDLAVVPLLVLIPALDESAPDMARAMMFAVLKAAVLLTLLLVGGQRVMRWWLTLVARRKSEELFVLNLLLITLGLAWLTEHAGLSLALGAFVAGMLVAETEFKHQVETDIRPFHDVLLGLFFITIGMKLDWRPVVDQWFLVLLLACIPVVAKAVLVAGLARAFNATPGVAIRTGLYLAQAGEFGFVLLALGSQFGLVRGGWLSTVLASMVLSMLATPFLVMYANRIVMKLSASEWLLQSVQLTTIAKKAIRTEAHVIIAGYGRCGQNMARMLEQEAIPYMALDLDPDRVRQAAAAGQSVVFGDAARLPSLMAAGLGRASAVVVSYLDTPSALKILALVREHAPKVPVIVRTLDDADLERLREAGATEVVPEAIEGSLMLAAQALALVGVPMRRVIRVTRDAREKRYGLLRGYFHGADDDTLEERQQARLASVTLPAAVACLGQPLGELALPAMGAQVVSVRQASGRVVDADDSVALQAGDTLVLSGLPEALAMAEAALLRP